jgi:hypothetical protein
MRYKASNASAVEIVFQLECQHFIQTCQAHTSQLQALEYAQVLQIRL